MIILKLLLMSVIGALIGWMTNIIAIKLLFRPIEPIKILFFEIQGLIPKRHAEIVHSVAQVVEKELLNMEQIFDTFIEKMDKETILETLELHICNAVVKNLPGLMRSFSGTITKYIHEVIENEGDRLLSEVTEGLLHKAVYEVSIAELVENRLLTYDLEKIEDIILQLSKRELVQIERLGGILGFIVGFVQGVLVLYIM